MTVFLDDLPPLTTRVGYGRLGLAGQLGYEDQPVVFNNDFVRHAISAHGPSAVEYEIGGQYTLFTAIGAINEDIPRHAKAGATFFVLGDERELGRFVVDNGNPAEIQVDVTGVQRLRLVVAEKRFEYCHAIWVNPLLTSPILTPSVTDCLGRVAIDIDRSQQALQLDAPRVIVTIASVKFDEWLDGMLRSLKARGGCAGYPIVVFLVDADEKVEAVVRKHGCLPIYGQPLTKRDPGLKSVMYSVGRLMPKVGSFLCLDADMIIYDSLKPLFDTLEATSPESIAIVRDVVNNSPLLREAFLKGYKGTLEEFKAYFDLDPSLLDFPFVVNDGIFAAGGEAMRLVDRTIRNWPRANACTYNGGKVIWRNQFVFNLALAVLRDVIPLDQAYNIQLHKMAAVWSDDTPYWNSRPAKVLHFTGPAKFNKTSRRLPPDA